MNNKISEEEQNEKIITLCGELEDIGEKALSKKLFEKIAKKIQVVEYDNWMDTQICASFPDFSPLCFIHCCSPAKRCVFRRAALRYLGLTEKDYRDWKEKMVENVGDLLKKGDSDGKSKSD